MVDIIDEIIAREKSGIAVSTEIRAGILIVQLRAEIDLLRRQRDEWTTDRAQQAQRMVTELQTR